MTWNPGTVADQKTPLVAIAQIAAEFPYLPGAVFGVNYIYPAELVVSLHEDLAHFEQWRVAFGVDAGAVEYDTQPGNMVLTAKVDWRGASVKLIGYGPLPLHELERGVAA